MKWSYAINQKIKMAWLLLGAFALILTTNWVEKKNVSALGTSFTSVYEDRLLAESYLYELSDLAYQNHRLLQQTDTTGNNQDITAETNRNTKAIQHLIAAFAKTHLTPSEKKYFQILRSHEQRIIEMEGALSKSELNSPEREKIKEIIILEQEALFHNLRQLSRIQIEQGTLLNKEAKSIIAGSQFISYLEIVVLFGLAVVIQTLIFAQKSISSKLLQQSHLN